MRKKACNKDRTMKTEVSADYKFNNNEKKDVKSVN